MPEDLTPRTEAGHRDPPRPPAREAAFRRYRTFYHKNKGLVGRRLFWSALGRSLVMAAASRLRPRPAPRVQRIVVCHHKAMTTYFSAVLQVLAFATGARFAKFNTRFEGLSAADYALCMQGRVDFAALGAHRAVHVLRDPRDMIVSGYHYHKWCDERWVHRLDDNGLSYQQKLRARSKRDGLFMEIDHFTFMNREKLLEWPIDDPAVMEAPYEALMGDDRRTLYGRMFEHLGLDGAARRLAVDLMILFEADTRSSRRAAGPAEGTHIRSGRSGQWRDELEPEHLLEIERQLGDVMRKFGYDRAV